MWTIGWLVGATVLAALLAAGSAASGAAAAAAAQAPQLTAQREGTWLVLIITDRSVDERAFVVRHRAPGADEVEARRLPSLSRATVGRTYPVRFPLEQLEPGRHCFVAVAAGGPAEPRAGRPVCPTVPWPGRLRLS